MSPRQAAAAPVTGGREAQRRRTRQAIVEAAQVLLREGADPSVDDVAAAAQVSRRTIYLHFTTLDQLLLDASVGLMTENDVDAALDQADGLDDAGERVDALVRALLARADETLPMGRRIIRLPVDAPPAP